MKKTVLILIIAVSLLGLRAQVPTFPGNDSLANYLAGSWTWLSSCGGLSYGCTNPAISGYTQNMLITKLSGTSDSVAYQYFKNNVMIHQGYAKIGAGPSIFSGSSWTVAPIQGFTQQQVVVAYAKADSVTLSDDCSDCYAHKFVRGALPTGLPELSPNKQMSLFPVPAHGQVSIQGPADARVQSLQVYAADGKKVLQLFPENQTMDVSSLAPGIYFVELSTASGNYKTKLLKD